MNNELAKAYDRIKRDNLFGFLHQERTAFRFDNARELLRATLAWLCLQEKRELEWLPEYDEVAEYLQNPEGKGLLLYGDCGRGKSLIVTKALPLMLNYHYRKIFQPIPATMVNARNLPEVLKKQVLIIDDIGTEPIKEYGEQRSPISQIIDEAERSGRLLYLTSNLDVAGQDPTKSIEGRYGSRTYDRLVSLVRLIEFRGNSLRQ